VTASLNKTSKSATDALRSHSNEVTTAIDKTTQSATDALRTHSDQVTGVDQERPANRPPNRSKTTRAHGRRRHKHERRAVDQCRIDVRRA
jgi:hypothetical protein